MKRNSGLIAGAVIAAVLVIQIMFWASCSQEESDQDDLRYRVEMAPFIPPEQVPTYEELEQLQAESEERLALQREIMPQEISAADVVKDILGFAQASRVTALPLYSVPVSEEDVEGSLYFVLRMNIRASGEFSPLMDFIDLLEDGTIKALVVEEMSLIQSEDSWSADIEAVIYAGPVPDSEEGMEAEQPL